MIIIIMREDSSWRTVDWALSGRPSGSMASKSMHCWPARKFNHRGDENPALTQAAAMVHLQRQTIGHEKRAVACWNRAYKQQNTLLSYYILSYMFYILIDRYIYIYIYVYIYICIQSRLINLILNLKIHMYKNI